MFPTREEALKLIRDGLLFNPGPWGKHCLTAAHCAEKIASACGDMDVEKAYILGLLHDIGRKFGVRHLGHVYDGYVYMKSLGYDEAAKICLYYNVHLMDDNIPLDGVFHGYDELDNERIDLDFCWVSLEDLKKGTKVYPLELIPYILESGKEIVHFVSKQI